MVNATFTIPNLKKLEEFFVADMHFHTAYSHDCTTPVKDIINLARKRGIHVAITDHNRIGGVLEARKFKDAPIIAGIEICSKEGKEVIAYFYDDKELEKFYDERLRPSLKEKNAMRSSRTPFSMQQLLTWLSEYECVRHLPHPFAPQPRRSYPYFNRKMNKWMLNKVDSIEVFNANVTRKGNLAALGWSVHLSKGGAGGSDGHDLKWLGHGITISKAASVKEHLDNIKSGAIEVQGVELKPKERVWNYATTTVKTKLSKGVSGGIKKGLSLPRKVLNHL